MLKQKSGVILTAAKVDDGLSQLFGEISPALIPVNGRPLIFHQIENFIKIDVDTIYISVGYKKDRLIELVQNYYQERIKIVFIEVDYNLAPGNSLISCLKEVESGMVIINLGDTFLPSSNYVDDSNKVYISKSINQSKRWSKVNLSEKQIVSFYEKDEVADFALIGAYVISEVINIDLSFINEGDNYEITDILKLCKLDFKGEIEYGWLDFGHIDKYQSSKKRLLEARGFNSLEFNDLLGTITKRSKNVNKFLKEIDWQLNVPNELKVLSPRILDYSIGKNPFIEMEYYSYPTISELWLYASFDEAVLERVISKTYEILLCFEKHKETVSSKSYHHIYIEKTQNRITELKSENSKFSNLLKSDYININGVKLKNWNLLKGEIELLVPELYNENHNCFIHGDFCFSNILFDINSGIVRIIDPRGIWGEDRNGDIKYDIAKLRHSVNGDYDFIVQDLFDIKEKPNNEINYRIFNSDKHIYLKRFFDGLLEEKFNLKHIQLIEGLLFLSMIPLHKGNERRQLVMFCKALENLNKL